MESWIDEGLADDVASISYEHALRTHARPRRPDLSPDLLPLPGLPSDRVSESGPAASTPPQPVRITEWVPDDQRAALAPNRKSSSVTLRLSPRECEQVHARAADAGLTVSAYLRSCIFEVETLRVQVKEALAHLRPGSVPDAATQWTEPLAATPKDWRSRLFAHWHRNRNHADA